MLVSLPSIFLDVLIISTLNDVVERGRSLYREGGREGGRKGEGERKGGRK